MGTRFYAVVFFVLLSGSGWAQQQGLWHGIERSVRYHPEGKDIVIENGTRRFNRALYGGNTAFRAEAGDLPEFALYLPGMGGNMKFGILLNDSSKWLNNCKRIKAIYRAGSMLYEVEDDLFGKGKLFIHAIASYDREAFTVKMDGVDMPAGIKLVVVYGAATGKKFSRDGDIGADPESSFYLQPGYCAGNTFETFGHQFKLSFDSNKKTVDGVFPPLTEWKICDANAQQTLKGFLSSAASDLPVLSACVPVAEKKSLYFHLNAQHDQAPVLYNQLPAYFTFTDSSRNNIAQKIQVNTPDAHINALAPALGIAADAVWEDPSFMHGAVAWRMRLNGWRGAYVADVMGWHDRARMHFEGYAKSQVTAPLSAPIVADTALNLARQAEKLGTSLFSSGYISRNPGGDKRAHHYDMNLVFIDQLLNHLKWTGDTAFLRQAWPLLTRHLDWEKRNFDVDGDGLYDAYAAIWASDALQYSGGGVTHSSAYNFRANKLAAELAEVLKLDGAPYKAEAEKILKAVNNILWLDKKGWYAEYKDLLGNQLLHDAPGVWTIYHAIDGEITNPFQAYQSLRYIDHHIPHIPIRAKGLKDTAMFTLSTTNWQPYTWSLNNVALSELMHVTLAEWQGGRRENAFQLWKSSLMESMYLGASPGNIQQLTFYDAIRGELYRDFADAIGMTGRSLVEGLFGIQPDLMNRKILVKPGFPTAWPYASLKTKDIDFSYNRLGLKAQYKIKHVWGKAVAVCLEIPARMDQLAVVTINGVKAAWEPITDAVGTPMVRVIAQTADQYDIQLTWAGNALEIPSYPKMVQNGKPFSVTKNKGSFTEILDPQGIMSSPQLGVNKLTSLVKGNGVATVFLLSKQGQMKWWQPLDLNIVADAKLPDAPSLTLGPSRLDTISLRQVFNDKVTNIFQNKYSSPRPAVPTLQLPLQGIGNWAYPLINPEINDSGFRKMAEEKDIYTTSKQLVFSTPSDARKKNIAFTSMWDHFPDSISIPLEGKALHAYFLMAGTTNAMQSRIVNGEILVYYRDGSFEKLELKNPENWCPIEQDFYEDGFAFSTGAKKPIRIALKTGKELDGKVKYVGIKGYSGFGVEGGAASVLELPLNREKILDRLVLRSIANDVIIGMMGLTLKREVD